MQVRLPVKGKEMFFLHLGLDPMFVTNGLLRALHLTTTTTTSLFEKLNIHMFSFLNNSMQYGVSEISQLFHC